MLTKLEDVSSVLATVFSIDTAACLSLSRGGAPFYQRLDTSLLMLHRQMDINGKKIVLKSILSRIYSAS